MARGTRRTYSEHNFHHQSFNSTLAFGTGYDRWLSGVGTYILEWVRLE